MKPKYDLDKIKFSTDEPTYKRAVDLYEKGKVTQFREGIGTYSAVVLGTKPYGFLGGFFGSHHGKYLLINKIANFLPLF